MPLRADKWWNYKIPPMLAFAYYALLSAPGVPPLRDTVTMLALFLVAVIGIAGFGHVFTDIFDVEEDRVRGQSNIWAGLSDAKRAALITSLLAASWIPWLFIPIGTAGIMLVASEFLMFALYAVPPVRLKTRGFPGIVADSMYAHVLPALWTWIPFARFAYAETPLWLGLIAAAWALIVGMRELLHHQAVDANSDRRAGVSTYGALKGRDNVIKIVLNRLLPLELMAFAALLGALTAQTVVVVVGFAAYLGWSVFKIERRWIDPVGILSGPQIDDRATIICRRILSPFYYAWLPILLLIALTLKDSTYAVLLLLHLLLFRGAIMRLASQEVSDIASVMRRA